MYKPIEGEIFHVHTKRCKHASDDEDYQYVETAVRLGAPRIVFTDHAPFRGNPFRNRMDFEQLSEYISSMKTLKKEYRSQIEVLYGLEIEYLPTYDSYYRELKGSGEFDLLMLGQHFYETEDGDWSFNKQDKSDEYKGLCKAIVQGIETDLFDVVAHPDRSFRRCQIYGRDVMGRGYDIIHAVFEHPVCLEKNYSSMRHANHYWDDFWIRTPRENIIEGFDAHSVKEMEEMWIKHKYILPSQDEINRMLCEVFAVMEGEL